MDIEENVYILTAGLFDGNNPDHVGLSSFLCCNFCGAPRIGCCEKTSDAVQEPKVIQCHDQGCGLVFWFPCCPGLITYPLFCFFYSVAWLGHKAFNNRFLVGKLPCCRNCSHNGDFEGNA